MWPEDLTSLLVCSVHVSVTVACHKYRMCIGPLIDQCIALLKMDTTCLFYFTLGMQYTSYSAYS